MGLKDEYQEFLIKEKKKEEKEEKKRNALGRERALQSQMPSEFSFVPLTLSSDISNLISDFIDLVPSGSWHSFPTNGTTPTLPDYAIQTQRRSEGSILGSWYNYIWFLQVMWLDETRRTVPIWIDRAEKYYREWQGRYTKR